jgi:hypothetical protein
MSHEVAGFAPADDGWLVDVHRLRSIIEDGHDPYTPLVREQAQVRDTLTGAGLAYRVPWQGELHEFDVQVRRQAPANLRWLACLPADALPHWTLARLHEAVSLALLPELEEIR